MHNTSTNGIDAKNRLKQINAKYVPSQLVSKVNNISQFFKAKVIFTRGGGKVEPLYLYVSKGDSERPSHFVFIFISIWIFVMTLHKCSTPNALTEFWNTEPGYIAFFQLALGRFEFLTTFSKLANFEKRKTSFCTFNKIYSPLYNVLSMVLVLQYTVHCTVY